ncbi:MAG TPA: serine hydrolase domain-containing protein [Puia sp.]|nr:serine hydrolase domain-containing protein [Puia sp.]
MDQTPMTLLKHCLLPILVLLVCSSMLQAQPKGLDTFINHRVRDHRFSGVVLVAALNSTDPPLFLKAYGDADREKGIPVGTDTKFITASTAKTFTAVGILQLVESGKVNLSLPLSRYLPDSVYPQHIADRITIRQLLTHTAGLGDVITGKAFRSAPQEFQKLADVVALVRKEGPVDSAGKFLYGTSDYILLGAVIESVTGQSFTMYMAEHVFRPAGMLNSGFDLAERPSGLAHGYTARNIGKTDYAWPVMNAAGDTVAVLRLNDGILPRTGIPGSVAYTTATDLLRFARALAGDRLLKKETLAEMWRGQVPTGREGANRQYGYGFFVGEVGRQPLINHGGTGPGIDVCFDIYPGLGEVVVILSNLDPPAAQDVRQYIREKNAKLPLLRGKRIKRS